MRVGRRISRAKALSPVLWAGFPSLKAQYSAVGSILWRMSSDSAAGSVPRPTVRVKAGGQWKRTASQATRNRDQRVTRQPATRAGTARPPADCRSPPACSDKVSDQPRPDSHHATRARFPALRRPAAGGQGRASFAFAVKGTLTAKHGEQPARTSPAVSRTDERARRCQTAGLLPGFTGKLLAQGGKLR